MPVQLLQNFEIQVDLARVAVVFDRLQLLNVRGGEVVLHGSANDYVFVVRTRRGMLPRGI